MVQNAQHAARLQHPIEGAERIGGRLLAIHHQIVHVAEGEDEVGGSIGHGRLALLAGKADQCDLAIAVLVGRSEEHTSELQSLMRISYAVFCLKKKKNHNKYQITNHIQKEHN